MREVVMKKAAIAMAVLAASLTSTAVWAQGYVSAAAGASRADIDCGGTLSCDKNDTAYKIVGGYGFGSGFAAELGYISFGKAKASAAGARAEVETTGVMLGLAYQAQFNNQWGGNVRLGAARMKADVTGAVSGFGSAADSDTKTVPYLGLGVNYAFTRNVRAELSADFSRSEYRGQKNDVQALMVGVRYDF